MLMGGPNLTTYTRRKKIEAKSKPASQSASVLSSLTLTHSTETETVDSRQVERQWQWYKCSVSQCQQCASDSKSISQ